MKNIIFLFIFYASIGIVSCKKKSPVTPSKVNVMFVNGCVGTPYVNVEVNATTLTAAGDLNYLSNTGYLAVTGGTNVILGFIFPGTANNIGSGIDVSTSSSFSIFLGGSAITGPSFSYTVDDLSAPPVGMAKVRFVNLSTDTTLILNCFIAGQKIDSNVSSLGYTTDFLSIPATAAQGDSVLLQDNSSSVKLATLSNQMFAAGKIYTIMFADLSTAGNNTHILTIINNN